MKLKAAIPYILWITAMGAGLWVIDSPLWAKDVNQKKPAVIMRRQPVKPLKPVAPIARTMFAQIAHGVSMNNWIGNQNALETTLRETSTFVLVAKNRAGKTASKKFIVRVKPPKSTNGTCTISGRVYPKLRWRVKLSPNRDAETFQLKHIAVYRSGDSKLLK